MKKKPQTPLTDGEILRQKAEEQLKRKSSKTDLKRSEADAQKLIHELQVHQIELEIQNEELLQAKVAESVATQKYIELYDFAPTGYFTLSKEGKIIMLNLKCASMLGKERQRLINNTFSLFVSHDTRPIFNNFLSKVFEGKQGESCELTISIDANKQPLNVILTGHVPENSEECQMTMVDITERKQNEQKLLQSDRVFNLSLDMFCIAGFDGYFKYLNPAWERILGWSIEELLSKPWLDFVHPDDAENTQNIKSVIVGGKEIYRFENRYICKDGSIKWFSWNSQPFPKENIMIGAVRDITETKRIENELTKNEKLLNETGRIAKIGGWELDVETMTSYPTQETKRIYGISLDADVPSGIEGIKNYPEEAQKKLQKLVQDAIEKGTPYDVELPFINIQGKHLWVRTIGVPEKKDGKVTRLYGTLQDITERKHADEVLRSSQEMLLSSQSVANICSYSTNLNPTEINKSQWECSPEFYKVFGIDETYPHTIEGWIGFLHPDYRKEVAAYHESVVLEKKSFDREYKIIRINDGVERWVHGTGELVYDEKGNPIRMYGAIQDITERKQVELALKESERKLIEAQELSHVGSWDYIIDTDTVTWSKELFNIFERSYDLPAPKYSEQQQFYTEESFDLLDKAIHDCVHREISYEIELDIITASGSVKQIISVGKVKKDNKNKVIGSYGTAQDITKQKSTEFELISAREKAEESDRLKSAFLANMSHEIRTPMNGILGFTNLLREPNLTGKEQQKYIDIIQKSGDRMLRTVNDIIDVSRIESGLVELSVSEVNINDKLTELHSFFNPEASKKGIQLVYKSNKVEQEIKCITDLEKLSSILTNLIKNAIKFTNQGTIEFGYRIDKDRGSSKLEFYVKDSGIGIPKNRQTAVFDRFVQADIEDKSAHQGSGLGLTISKAYCEILGGEIWVESEEGEGSTFYFTVDYNPETEPKSSTNNDEQILKKDEDSRKLKILVVDDDETSQYYISIVVDSFTKEIITVISGIEAVEACKSNPDIDLILMDIKLPDMNGYEATRQIREFNKEVIIIAQTAHALTGDLEKSIEAGCNDYISKPIKMTHLHELINKHCNK